MKKRTRSILEELSSLGRAKDVESLIETRGANIIESSINLLTLVRQHFNEEEAQEIERRFLNSIRTANAHKFQRGVRRVVEARKSVQNPPVSE